MLLLIASLGTAEADPGERSDRVRAWNLAPFAAGGAFYLLLELRLKDVLMPEVCRWCRANAFDARLRHAGKWDNVERAASISNVTGYFGSPTFAIGALLLSSIDEPDARRSFDDVVPVMQAAVVTGMLNQASKLLFVRRRPYAEFKGRSTRGKNDVNTSFFSGHTSLAFTMVASAGTVATLRDYKTAPVIWIGGGLLALTTGYLRIAADAHYATDVITGAAIGSIIGVAIPLLFHEEVLTDEEPVARTRSDRTFMLSLGSWRF